MTTPLKTPFDTWLSDVSGGNLEAAATMLEDMFHESLDQEDILWERLEDTGDREYTRSTFFKVAKTCLDKPDNPEIRRGI
jgi:hypothetical protein